MLLFYIHLLWSSFSVFSSIFWNVCNFLMCQFKILLVLSDLTLKRFFYDLLFSTSNLFSFNWYLLMKCFSSLKQFLRYAFAFSWNTDNLTLHYGNLFLLAYFTAMLPSSTKVFKNRKRRGRTSYWAWHKVEGKRGTAWIPHSSGIPAQLGVWGYPRLATCVRAVLFLIKA